MPVDDDGAATSSTGATPDGGRRHGRRGVAAVALAGLAVLLIAVAAFVATGRGRPGVPGTPFSDGGAWIYHYIHRTEPFDFAGQHWAYGPTAFKDITARLEAGWYTDRGITNLAIYGPYDATGEWRGLPAVDHMGVSPENGTIEDFEAMARAANERGITLTAYMAFIYLSPLNELFVQAQQDVRDGIDSRARRLFRWDERQPPAPGPDQGGTPPPSHDDPPLQEGDWAFSEIAGRWYATSWGMPALDHATQETRDYVKEVIRFWMDRGVQGFEYDAPQSTWGMQGSDEPRQREIFIDTPQAHRPDLELITIAEGAGTFDNQQYTDRVGFSHVIAEGGDTDFESFTLWAIEGRSLMDVDRLEDHWATYVDSRRINGRGVLAATLYHDIDPQIRALEAAIKAGMGAIYQVEYEQLLADSPNRVLAPDEQERIWEIFRALRRSPALAPRASRERLPLAPDPSLYAVIRRSADREATVINLYNLSPEPRCATLDLRGTGIELPQQPIDLATNTPIEAFTTEHPTVELPGHGWRFLAVDAQAPEPWTMVDDADATWSVGDGWSRIADASASAGSRVGGNVEGGFVEVPFEGRTVEGWGRMGDRGAAEVEVFVDGVSHGLHSQRRTAPVPGGGGRLFYGQRLFTVTDLDDGQHVLRLVQRSATGLEGVDTSVTAGLDYLRVSSSPAAEWDPIPPGVCDD